jgi:hypothetical protein
MNSTKKSGPIFLTADSVLLPYFPQWFCKRDQSSHARVISEKTLENVNQ